MKALIEKWQKKLRKGDPDFEGFYCSDSEVIHMVERMTTKGAECGVKMWRKGDLVCEYERSNDAENQQVSFGVVIKKMREVLIQIEGMETGYYLGPGEDHVMEDAKIDEALLYFNGPQSGFLIHILAGDSLKYLVNVGSGNECRLIKDLWKCYRSWEESR